MSGTNTSSGGEKVMAMPVTEMVFPLATCLSAKVAAAELSVNTSPAIRLSDSVTVAEVVRS